MNKEKKDEIIKFIVNLNDCYYDGIDGQYYKNGSEISIKDELYLILRASGYCPPYTCKDCPFGIFVPFNGHWYSYYNCFILFNYYWSFFFLDFGCFSLYYN